MSVKAYKFSSPGIFLNEIDQSQVQQAAAPVGPIIVGRAQRGPSMRPVTVASYDEFVQTFGDPGTGGDSSGDSWIRGVPSGVTFAPYAAKAWLPKNPTVTFVRLLGVQSDTATDSGSPNAGEAGWVYGKNDSDPTQAVGAYGLYVFNDRTFLGSTASSDGTSDGIDFRTPANGDFIKINIPASYTGLERLS